MHEDEDDDVHDVKQIGVEGEFFRRQVKDVIIYDHIPFNLIDRGRWAKSEGQDWKLEIG